MAEQVNVGGDTDKLLAVEPAEAPATLEYFLRVEIRCRNCAGCGLAMSPRGSYHVACDQCIGTGYESRHVKMRVGGGLYTVDREAVENAFEP